MPEKKLRKRDDAALCHIISFWLCLDHIFAAKIGGEEVAAVNEYKNQRGDTRVSRDIHMTKESNKIIGDFEPYNGCLLYTSILKPMNRFR